LLRIEGWSQPRAEDSQRTEGHRVLHGTDSQRIEGWSQRQSLGLLRRRALLLRIAGVSQRLAGRRL